MTTKEPGIQTVGRSRKGDIFFLAEVDLPKEGNLYDWRVIKIPVKGRMAVLGNAVAFGIDESFGTARYHALDALREALEE